MILSGRSLYPPVGIKSEYGHLVFSAKPNFMPRNPPSELGTSHPANIETLGGRECYLMDVFFLWNLFDVLL